MLTDGTRTMTYDYDNMPKTITKGGITTTFVYDGNGNRVKKITPSQTTVYIGKLYECNGSACSKYIFANGSRIAQKSGTSVYYYHTDHLGSTSVVTNESAVSQGAIYYKPFGATLTGDVPTNHLYTQQEFDEETGLYNYNARFYNPTLGRFISADSIVPDARNPQAFNRYSYVINNPPKYTDPSGHRLKHIAKNVKEVFRPVHQVANVIHDIRDTLTNQGNRFEHDVRKEGPRFEHDVRKEGPRAETEIKTIADIVVRMSTFQVDPALQLTALMVGLQFSPMGLETNMMLTHGRLPKPAIYHGMPVVEDSMFGNIGSRFHGPGGFTPGPIAFFSPGLSENVRRHEIGHELQYWQKDGFSMTYDWIFRNEELERDADNQATEYFDVLVRTQ